MRTPYNINRQYASNGDQNSQPHDRMPPSAARTEPLVGVKPQEQAQNPYTLPKSSPRSTSAPSPLPKPDSTVVAYPYLRISLGVLLCGSIIYSMVLLPT